MILVGQYDSPFVRRVAVAMHLHGMPFERQVLSVFGDFAEMLKLNPLGKVPVLQLDDGELLFDSRTILDYLDGLLAPDGRLVPPDEPHRLRVSRIEAVALGLMEKLYERVFEYARRDPTKRDAAVIERVEQQIASALSWLEALRPSPWLYGDRLTRADLTTAIGLTYMRQKAPTLLKPEHHKFLVAHCAHCESLSQFARAAYSADEARRSGWTSEAGAPPR
jgi:glutathione S-transferase